MPYSANAASSELIEEGTYAGTIESVSEMPNYQKTDNQLVITWDLKNGRKLFDRVSKDKDGSGDYSHYKIGLILYAVRLEGEINSTDDLIKKLVGCKCKLQVQKLFSAAKNGDYNSVKSYDIDLEAEAEPQPSKPAVAPVPSADKKPVESDGIEVADDDLPF